MIMMIIIVIPTLIRKQTFTRKRGRAPRALSPAHPGRRGSTSAYLSIHPSIYLSIHLSISLPLSLSLYIYICIHIHGSISLYIYIYV